jgi:hypothetical protein
MIALVVASGSQAFALYGDGTEPSRTEGTWALSIRLRRRYWVADLNEDGRLDIAASTGDGFELLLGP